MQTIKCLVIWLLLGCAGLAAEPRWCNITGRAAKDTLVYPPIAKAARVQGVVLGRVIYEPAGKFVRFEAVSGPKMLQVSVERQLSTWNFETDAPGDQLCESLVIAQFQFDDLDHQSPAIDRTVALPSVIKVSITSVTLVISDPMGVISKNPLTRIAWHIRLLVRKVCQH